jgi:hypothetical protein
LVRYLDSGPDRKVKADSSCVKDIKVLEEKRGRAVKCAKQIEIDRIHMIQAIVQTLDVAASVGDGQEFKRSPCGNQSVHHLAVLLADVTLIQGNTPRWTSAAILIPHIEHFNTETLSRCCTELTIVDVLAPGTCK